MAKNQFNQVGEVKGKPGVDQEAFSFQFTPQNENLRRTRGSLFTLVNLKGKTDEPFEKAKTFYHAFQSSYYAKVNGSIINSLSETVDQLEKDFAKKENEILEYSLVAAVLWGAVLYLVKSGSGGVWISRGEKLRKLDFNKVASGILEDQDTICLTDQNFNEAVSEEELGSFLALEKFTDVLEKIDSKIKQIAGTTCLVVRLAAGSEGEGSGGEGGNEELTIADINNDGETQVSQEVKEEVTGEEEVVTEEKMPETAVVAESAPAHFPPEIKPKTDRLAFLTPLIESLTKFGQKFAARVAAPWKKPTPGELVDHVAIRRQRLGQVVIVVVLILVLSIGRSFLSHGSSTQKDKVSQLISSATSQLSEAKNIKTIDPNRAKTLISGAQSDLAAAKKIDSKNKEVSSLETQASELIAEVTRSFQTKLTTVFDFSKVISGANLTAVALSGSTITVTDTTKNSVYQLDLTTSSGSKVDGSFTSPGAVAGYSSGFYIQNANEVDSLKNGGSPVRVGDGSVWGKIVSGATYQANLYLLDSEKKEIWRYLSTGAGLASPKAYTAADKPDLARATGIAIDDYVWVVTKDGVVYKFAQGKKQEFSFSNFTGTFSDVVAIFTDSESKNIYILDRGSKSLVVFDKNGVYQAAYANDSLEKASGVVVQEAAKTAYIAVGSKIVSLSLR